MPELSDIIYSRDATVAAFRDYYQFLTKIYLKEPDPIEPPKGCWPTITPEILAGLEKYGKVVDLLRHLPYIRCSCDESPDAAPWAKMMDWRHDKIPSTVLGLLDIGPDVECFFLDTDQGTVYWPECHIQYDPTIPFVEDDPYDYCENDKEADWRSGGCWAIPNFFKLLKCQFRDLQFIPISTEKVISSYDGAQAGEEGMQPMLQAIYREHGWPDLDSYRKEQCLKAVQKAQLKHFPDRVDYHEVDEAEENESE